MRSIALRALAVLALYFASTTEVEAQRVIKVAAAANLRYVMSEIETAYESNFEDVDLQINYGASGTFYQQIINGAPYNLFLSADDILPTKLEEQGVTSGKPRIYACGKLALYGLRDDVDELMLKVLEEPSINRISLANPRTAPYGTRSVELLKSLGLWSGLEKKVVYGDSIAQAAQFAMTGNAELGFVALSLLLNPEVELKGSYYTIPDNLYAPIAQAGVLIKDDTAAQLFYYLLGDECEDIWDRYGYSTAE